MPPWLRAVLVLLVVFSWVRPAIGQASSECADLAKYAPPGSLVVTRGEIIGQPNEHVPMTSKVPSPASDGGVGYLVTGDQVESVAACQGFSYVRYHGKNRTTSGWIDSRRLQLRGKPFVPLPANASELCSTVERELSHGVLHVVEAKRIPDGVTVVDENDPSSPRPLGYIPLTVGDRRLSVVQMADGGTCSSTEAEIRSGDLKYALSPDDAVSRHPFQFIVGGNAWSVGLDEDVVSVEGKPLLRSRYKPGSDFALSTIDRTGDTQFVCYGRLRPWLSRPVVIEGNPALCEAIASSAVPVAMHSPQGHFMTPPQQIPEVELHAVQWGMVDLDNVGQEFPVGVINYTYSSGAGCGHGFDLDFPLPLDGATVSWPQAMKGFQALYGDEADSSRPWSKLLVRMVRHDDQTYVELLDASLLTGDEIEHAPVQSVWKFTSAGPKQICKYKTAHYEVRPPSTDESGQILQ